LLLPGFEACHHCDNPPCVRDDHLFPGTQVINMLDAKRKGRLSQGPQHRYLTSQGLPRGDAHWMHRAPEQVRHGEGHWAASLSEAEALEILSLKGIESQYDLARRFGVSRNAVAAIHQRKNWKHLPHHTVIQAAGLDLPTACGNE
jgi:hypothetical protein